MQIVWLRADVQSFTAHAFEDYLETPYGAFLAVHASGCGIHRDPATRVPVDFRVHRICLRCSAHVERRARRTAS